jgi:hypothetical protein
MRIEIIGQYLWLLAGCLCLWIGLKAVIYIHAFDAPSSPSVLLFVAPVCFYQFAKIRRQKNARRL